MGWNPQAHLEGAMWSITLDTNFVLVNFPVINFDCPTNAEI